MDELHTAHGEVKDWVRRHWGRRAPTFDERPHHGLHNEDQHQAWLGVLKRVAPPPAQTVLDVGCGTGFLSLMLAELGHDVTGVDLAPEMLDVARRKAEALGLSPLFRLGDAEALEAPDGHFDLIVARHLVWTLPDPVRAVREWQRVLKPSGKLALIEGRWDNRSPQPEYEGILERLPFYGGVAGDRLMAFLAEQGMRDIVMEPLMDPVLWGEEPVRPRYLVVSGAAAGGTR